MYTLIIKTAEGHTAKFGGNRCIYDYESFDELMNHVKEIEGSSLMRKYGWRLIISQSS